MNKILEYVQKTEEKLIILAKYRPSYYTQYINKSNLYYATSADSNKIEQAIIVFERAKQKFLEDAYYSQAIRHVYYEQTGTTPEELGGHLKNSQEVGYYLEAKKNFLDLKRKKKFDNELLKEFEDKFVENDESCIQLHMSINEGTVTSTEALKEITDLKNKLYKVLYKKDRENDTVEFDEYIQPFINQISSHSFLLRDYLNTELIYVDYKKFSGHNNTQYFCTYLLEVYRTKDQIIQNLPKKAYEIKRKYEDMLKYYIQIVGNKKIKDIVQKIHEIDPDVTLHTVARNHLNDDISSLEGLLEVQLQQAIGKFENNTQIGERLVIWNKEKFTLTINKKDIIKLFGSEYKANQAFEAFPENMNIMKIYASKA